MGGVDNSVIYVIAQFVLKRIHDDRERASSVVAD